MKFWMRIAWTGLAFSMVACLDMRVAGPEKEGNSSETVAMVGGRVVDVNGNTVSGARVALIPDDFNPLLDEALPTKLTTHTDNNGEYFLSKVPKGRYGVEAIHPKDGTRSFNSGTDLMVETSIPADTLRASGHIRIRLPDYLKEAKGSIFIPHTRYAWRVTGTMLEHGMAELDSLPYGVYAALSYSSDTNISNPDTVGRNVAVHPAETTVLDALAGWRGAARITVNTGVSGANVGDIVTAFPMLLRLDAGNFDFSQASVDGRDLRFTKPDGQSLPFQIEHWDVAKSVAAVWVALDTVRGNNATQFFLMRWGKPDADSHSDGLAVFNSSAGYTGVWHIEEEAAGTGTMGIYRNSASGWDHGLDSLASTDRQGIIGNGHLFRNGEYVRVPMGVKAFEPKPPLSLSAWVKAKTTGISGGEIASLGNDMGIRILPDGNAFLFNFNPPGIDSTNFRMSTTGLHLLDDAWHQVVGIVTGTHAELYVDGNLAAENDYPTAIFENDGGPDFFIGHHGNSETEYDFNGYIDEVRVLPGTNSAAWLKLAYATQKPGATVLKISR